MTTPISRVVDLGDELIRAVREIASYSCDPEDDRDFRLAFVSMQRALRAYDQYEEIAATPSAGREPPPTRAQTVAGRSPHGRAVDGPGVELCPACGSDISRHNSAGATACLRRLGLDKSDGWRDPHERLRKWGRESSPDVGVADPVTVFKCLTCRWSNPQDPATFIVDGTWTCPSCSVSYTVSTPSASEERRVLTEAKNTLLYLATKMAYVLDPSSVSQGVADG